MMKKKNECGYRAFCALPFKEKSLLSPVRAELILLVL